MKGREGACERVKGREGACERSGRKGRACEDSGRKGKGILEEWQGGKERGRGVAGRERAWQGEGAWQGSGRIHSYSYGVPIFTWAGRPFKLIMAKQNVLCFIAASQSS